MAGHWVVRGVEAVDVEPPVRGGSWLVGWPLLPLEPPSSAPGKIITWSLLSYLAFKVAGTAASSEDSAAEMIASLRRYRARAERALSRLYPVRGHRLWVNLGRCPEGGVAPIIRSPRIRLPGGGVYGVTVDYYNDDVVVSMSPGSDGVTTVEGGRLRCPGGRLVPLHTVEFAGRQIVVVVDGSGSVHKPDIDEERAVEIGAQSYSRGVPQLEALGFLPGAPRGGLSWLSRRGVKRLHEVYPPRAALSAAFSLATARGPAELLAALLFSAAASPWTRYGPDGFFLSLQRARPDSDVYWELDPLSSEGLLGAIDFVAVLAASWVAVDHAPHVIYASPLDPEAAYEYLVAALPRPDGVDRAVLAEEIAAHWAPPSLEPPRWDGSNLEAATILAPDNVVVGEEPGSEGVARGLTSLLPEGYRIVGVEALTAYGPRASWVHAERSSGGPGVLNAYTVEEARIAGRNAALEAARQGVNPGRALDLGASKALAIITGKWPLKRPDGSRVAVKSLLAVSVEGALVGLAEAYTGDTLDAPSRFYLTLRLLGPLPRSDAELLALASGETLARLRPLIVEEHGSIVAPRSLLSVNPEETIVGRLAAALRGGGVDKTLCRLAETLSEAPLDSAERRSLAGLIARCRGVSMEKWI